MYCTRKPVHSGGKGSDPDSGRIIQNAGRDAKRDVGRPYRGCGRKPATPPLCRHALTHAGTAKIRRTTKLVEHRGVPRVRGRDETIKALSSSTKGNERDEILRRLLLILNPVVNYAPRIFSFHGFGSSY